MRLNQINLMPLLITFFCGCQSARNFEIRTLEKEELHIVEIDSARITQECYFLNAEAENVWRHQYILYMLNEKNEVIPVYNPTNQDKSQCLKQFKKIKKILKGAARVKLCVRDPLKRITDTSSMPEITDFGPLGRHESPYHALTFDTICNAKDCFSISDTWTYTCPGFTQFSKN